MSARTGRQRLRAGESVTLRFELLLTPCKPRDTTAHWGHRYYQVGYPDNPIPNPSSNPNPDPNPIPSPSPNQVAYLAEAEPDAALIRLWAAVTLTLTLTLTLQP